MLPYLLKNMANNNSPCKASELLWGSPPPKGGWDLVIGADLTFNKASFQHLIATLCSACPPVGGARVLLVHDDSSVPQGHVLREQFFDQMAPRWFEVKRADPSDVPSRNPEPRTVKHKSCRS